MAEVVVPNLSPRNEVHVDENVVRVVLAMAAGANGAPGVIEPWDIATSYGADAVVAYDGRLYVSLRATIGDQPDTSPLDWQIVGSEIFTGDPNRLVNTDESGNAETERWISSLDSIVLPFPGDPTISLSTLAVPGMEKSEFGAFLLPDGLGAGELFGLIVHDLDGTKPTYFAIINKDTLSSPLQAGWFDGQNFSFVIYNISQQPVMMVNDDGFKLSDGETVTRIDNSLTSNSDTRIPTVQAVASAIANIDISITSDNFVDNDGIVWSDSPAVIPIIAGSDSDGSSQVSNTSERHRASKYLITRDMINVTDLKLRMNVSTGGSSDVFGVVFSDENLGYPVDLLHSTPAVTVTNDTEQVITFTFDEPFSLKSGTQVWLGTRNVNTTGTLYTSTEDSGANLTYSTPGVGPDPDWNNVLDSTVVGALNAWLDGEKANIVGQVGPSFSSISSSLIRTRVAKYAVSSDMLGIDKSYLRCWTNGLDVDVYGVVYEDNGGYPGNIIAYSDLETINNTDPENLEFTFGTAFDVFAGNVWLGFKCYPSVGASFSVGSTPTGLNYVYEGIGGAPEDPFPPGSPSGGGILDTWFFNLPVKVEATIIAVDGGVF